MKHRYAAFNTITGEAFTCTHRKLLKHLRGEGWVFSKKHWQIRTLLGIMKERA